MQWVLHIPMRTELVLHIGIAQDAHLGVEFAMDAENAPVKL